MAVPSALAVAYRDIFFAELQSSCTPSATVIGYLAQLLERWCRFLARCLSHCFSAMPSGEIAQMTSSPEFVHRFRRLSDTEAFQLRTYVLRKECLKERTYGNRFGAQA